MLPLWRLLPRAQRAASKGIYSGVQSVKPLDSANHIFGQASVTGSKRVRKMDRDIVCIEGIQGEQREISVSEARRVMSLASEYQTQGPSIQGTQENYSVTGLSGSARAQQSDTMSAADVHSSVLEGMDAHVSLNGCMQSTVPHPTGNGQTASGYGSYLNMPGGGNKLLDKYLAGSSQMCHQSKHFSTSTSKHVSQQGAQNSLFEEEEYMTDPSPQGIQGDNCIQFKLWMENCQRYNLPNCDEQLESIVQGRKTLAEVFLEQQEIIRLVAESYRNSEQALATAHSHSSAQGLQGNVGYSYDFAQPDPCPQGFQGNDCATYNIWAYNCKAFGFGDCDEKMRDLHEGRRTLHDVFNEQDELIRKIVNSYQQRRSYSTDRPSERP